MMTIAQQLPAILQRNSVWLPRLLSYLLVALIAISSAKLVWSMFSGDSASGTVSEVKTAPSKLVKPPPPKPDYGAQVARLHLMGKASVANNPAVADQNAPDTSLNLTLSGVLALGNGEGFAIIEDDTKKHKYYHIDDEITSGVTLHSVYPNYILLGRSGRTEKLSLPKASEKGLSTVNNSSQVSAPTTSNSFKNVAPATPPDPTDQGEPNLSTLKQQLTKNPSSLAKYITITSANDEETGQFVGYKVKPNGGSSGILRHSLRIQVPLLESTGNTVVLVFNRLSSIPRLFKSLTSINLLYLLIFLFLCFISASNCDYVLNYKLDSQLFYILV